MYVYITNYCRKFRKFDKPNLNFSPVESSIVRAIDQRQNHSMTFTTMCSSYMS